MARNVQAANPTWVWNSAECWNGGGFHHSVDLGFGLVDAKVAVRMAKTWDSQWTSANLVEKTVGSLAAPLPVPDEDPNGLEVTIQQDAIVGRIEFVTLRLDLPYTWAADLSMTLTSPGSTTTTLLSNKAGENDHPNSWTYTAAGFHSETGQGTWTVKIVDTFFEDVGVLNDIALTLHGTAGSADGPLCLHRGLLRPRRRQRLLHSDRRWRQRP